MGLKVILIYVLVHFIINSLEAAEILPVAFAWVSFTIIEYSLFALYSYILLKSSKFKKGIVVASIVYLVCFILYAVFYKISLFAITILIGVETIFILIFSFYSLYEQMNDTTTLFIYNKPAFWIILGMVLYLGGCFFIYLYASYLPENELNKLWIVTNIFSILKNIFFCIAIYLNAKPPKERLQYDVEISSLN